MAPAPKDERMQLRLSTEDRDMLRALADAAGEGESIVVRRLIRAAFLDAREQLHRVVPPKKKTPKR